MIYIYTKKLKIHSSCEIEYFVETHLCKLCVSRPRAKPLYILKNLKYTPAVRLNILSKLIFASFVLLYMSFDEIFDLTAGVYFHFL